MTTPNPRFVQLPNGAAKPLNAAELETYFNPTANPAGSVWRSLPDRFSDRMSITDFGVVGDGVTDDWAAYQAALNACAWNCELLHPAGLTTFISKELLPPSGTDLVVHGTIFLGPNATTLTNVMDLRGNNISIQGHGMGKINGNASQQTAPIGGAGGITSGGVQNVTSVLISGMEIFNCKFWPINLTLGCTDIVVSDCLFHDSGASPEFSHATNCHFVRCRSHDIADDGIALYAGCFRCSIRDCEVWNCTSGPIILADNAQGAACDSCSLTGNAAYNNSASGCVVQSNGAIHTNIIVSDNVCNNNGHNVAGSGAANYKITNTHHMQFSNNIGVGTVAFAGTSQTFGLLMQGDLQRIRVFGNILGNVIGPQSACIQYSQSVATNTGIEFYDNLLFDDQAVATTQNGLLIAPVNATEGAQITARNNKFSGAFNGALFTDTSGAVKFEGPKDTGASNTKSYTENISTTGDVTSRSLTTSGTITANSVIHSANVVIGNSGIRAGTSGLAAPSGVGLQFFTSGGPNPDASIVGAGGDGVNANTGALVMEALIFQLQNMHIRSSFANDAAAAAGGVPVDGLYRNGSVLQVRVA